MECCITSATISTAAAAAAEPMLEKRARGVSAMTQLFERLSRGDLTIDSEHKAHRSVMQDLEVLPKIVVTPKSESTSMATTTATLDAAPLYTGALDASGSDFELDHPTGAPPSQSPDELAALQVSSSSSLSCTEPVHAISIGAIEVITASIGDSLSTKAHVIKPICIQVLPVPIDALHRMMNVQSNSITHPGSASVLKARIGNRASEREGVFRAQFAMLAQLEEAWDDDEEEAIKEEKRAAEEAELAAMDARRRREVALHQLDQARHRQAEEAARQKQEAAARAASRREEARARARAAARQVGRDLFNASAGGAPILAGGGSQGNDEGLVRTISSLRTMSMRRGASAAAAVGRIRQKSAPALAQVSAIGHSAFGFALGVREGHRKTLSFSLLREDPSTQIVKGKVGQKAIKPPMTIRCPCTACGHLTTAVIDDSKINRGESGERLQQSVRVKCESCGADLAVRVTKRDPKLSI